MIRVQLNPDVMPTGSDLGVVNAARRSFGKRSELVCLDHTKGIYDLKEADKSLLRFLVRGMSSKDFSEFLDVVLNSAIDGIFDFDSAKDKLVEDLWKWRNTPTHDTPFNHAFMSFEVEAPIFVRAQLVKHEYLLLSEFSRRYITNDVKLFQPDVWRKKSDNKKQGSLEEGIDPDYNPAYLDSSVVAAYNKALDEGVCPEQARMLLPQSLMTSWTWSGTLGAFANMCKLRIHDEAQRETRYVAEEVYKHMRFYFPYSAKYLVKGV
jgi:thymidylate synthase (FAD)